MAILIEVWSYIQYFLALNLRSDVFWSVLPLVLCTILLISYFTRYEGERAGWNTYFSNALVLIFVSLNLFRYIYTLGGVGASNYLDYPEKSIAVVLLITAGSLFMRFNFGHLLPERYARILSSPLGVNLIAYGLILYVYSSITSSWIMIFSLLLLVLILGIIFELIKFPLKWIFILIEKEKAKERFDDLKEAKLQIDELKRELKFREKELKQINLRDLEREKKTAARLEKLIK